MASVRSSVCVGRLVCRRRSISSSAYRDGTVEYRCGAQLGGAPCSSLVQSVRHEDVWHTFSGRRDEGEGGEARRGRCAVQWGRTRRGWVGGSV